MKIKFGNSMELKKIKNCLKMGAETQKTFVLFFLILGFKPAVLAFDSIKAIVLYLNTASTVIFCLV